MTIIIALTWDVTVASTLADSYISASAKSAAAVAELAAMKNITKYATSLRRKCSSVGDSGSD